MSVGPLSSLMFQAAVHPQAKPAASARAVTDVAAAVAPKQHAQQIIERDAAAGRFVQLLIDPVSDSVLRRFPEESQLAFSRGIGAYFEVLRRDAKQ